MRYVEITKALPHAGLREGDIYVLIRYKGKDFSDPLHEGVPDEVYPMAVVGALIPRDQVKSIREALDSTDFPEEVPGEDPSLPGLRAMKESFGDRTEIEILVPKGSFRVVKFEVEDDR